MSYGQKAGIVVGGQNAGRVQRPGERAPYGVQYAAVDAAAPTQAQPGVAGVPVQAAPVAPLPQHGAVPVQPPLSVMPSIPGQQLPTTAAVPPVNGPPQVASGAQGFVAGTGVRRFRRRRVVAAGPPPAPTIGHPAYGNGQAHPIAGSPQVVDAAYANGTGYGSVPPSAPNGSPTPAAVHASPVGTPLPVAGAAPTQPPPPPPPPPYAQQPYPQPAVGAPAPAGAQQPVTGPPPPVQPSYAAPVPPAPAYAPNPGTVQAPPPSFDPSAQAAPAYAPTTAVGPADYPPQAPYTPQSAAAPPFPGPPQQPPPVQNAAPLPPTAPPPPPASVAPETTAGAFPDGPVPIPDSAVPDTLAGIYGDQINQSTPPPVGSRENTEFERPVFGQNTFVEGVDDGIRRHGQPTYGKQGPGPTQLGNRAQRSVSGDRPFGQ